MPPRRSPRHAPLGPSCRNISAAIARLLAEPSIPLDEADLAARFTGKGAWKKRLPQIIDTLEALGRVRRGGAGALIS